MHAACSPAGHTAHTTTPSAPPSLHPHPTPRPHAGGARSTLVNIAPPGRLPWEILDVDEDAPGVSWGVDLTGGKAEDPWKNALLSEETKEEMWELHSKRG